MQDNQDLAKNLRLAKIMQAVFLISTIIYAVILVFLRNLVDLEMETSTLSLVTVLLSILGIGTAIVGLKLPGWMVKRTRRYGIVSQSLLSAVILQSSLFESIAILGLVLGIIGAKLEIAVPFMVIAAGLFIITFPNEEKWKKWLE